jgi:hypothetical protein
MHHLSVEELISIKNTDKQIQNWFFFVNKIWLYVYLFSGGKINALKVRRFFLRGIETGLCNDGGKPRKRRGNKNPPHPNFLSFVRSHLSLEKNKTKPSFISRTASNSCSLGPIVMSWPAARDGIHQIVIGILTRFCNLLFWKSA